MQCCRLEFLVVLWMLAQLKMQSAMKSMIKNSFCCSSVLVIEILAILSFTPTYFLDDQYLYWYWRMQRWRSRTSLTHALANHMWAAGRLSTKFRQENWKKLAGFIYVAWCLTFHLSLVIKSYIRFHYRKSQCWSLVLKCQMKSRNQIERVFLHFQ